LLLASLQAPPSTPAQADERALPFSSTSEVSALPHSTQELKSKAMKIAKDALKTSLVLLNAALTGLPLPFKGAFTAVIEIIKIAEVITSYHRQFERNFT
jgi:hypothetical protein